MSGAGGRQEEAGQGLQLLQLQRGREEVQEGQGKDKKEKVRYLHIF